MADWDLNGIKELMDKMEATGLGELRVKDGEFELRLCAKQTQMVCVAPEVSAAGASSASPVPAAPAKTGTAAKEGADGNVVKAPIVGTFYASPAPDKPPFVQVGSRVKKGDVLFVIESMKLMNEIQSDYAGEVTEILVENAQGLEYNQPILVIK